MKSSLLPAILLLIISIQCTANPCGINQHKTITAKVSLVVDGDTLRITNGKKTIRLLGINTPEGSTEMSPPDPLSGHASHAIKTLLKKNNNQILFVRAKNASGKKDRYGRVLAHVFTKDGKNVQQHLLEKGFAFNMIYPPNLTFQSCYKAAALKARNSRLGLWRHKYYKPLEVSTLNDNNVHGLKLMDAGYRGRNFNHITGIVKSVRRSKRSLWINFQNNRLSIRIARKNLHYFTDYPPQDLTGKRIVVSGYITRNRSRHPRASKYYMVLRHPDMMRIQK